MQQYHPTESPIGNRLVDVLARSSQVAFPGAELIPGLIVGGTDARFFREGALDATAPDCSPHRSRSNRSVRAFHGNDERIDVESLGLAADFWLDIARDLLT